ncbi:MAG TPA: SRPBCC domain-containing protein [Polyangiaceae bacterium]
MQTETQSNSAADFQTTFTVEQTPAQVFDAIVDVASWWSGKVVGSSAHLGDVFTYEVEGMHFSRQNVVDFVPGKRLVWHVTDAELTFVKDRDEWKGTDIVFEITKSGDQTEVRFTHRGLTPADECFKQCSGGWSALVGRNLRARITTGKPQPSPWG